MRKLRTLDTHGDYVQEILDEFNERAHEFGVTEENLVTVNVLPPMPGVKVATGKGTSDPSVRVVFVYWSDE